MKGFRHVALAAIGKITPIFGVRGRGLRPQLALDEKDLRREPLETRKATLASLVRKAPAGIAFQ